MGVAGLIFEPQPPNFENQYNFWRCSNDAKMIFLISVLVSDFQRSVWSVPSISVAVLGLIYIMQIWYNMPKSQSISCKSYCERSFFTWYLNLLFPVIPCLGRAIFSTYSKNHAWIERVQMLLFTFGRASKPLGFKFLLRIQGMLKILSNRHCFFRTLTKY